MRFAVIVLASCAAFGQTTKVFHLTQNLHPGDMREIAMLLRSVADIQQLSIDESAKTVTLDASDGQVAMAGWLVQQLDLTAGAALSGVHEYRAAAGGDDALRVLYATHAATPPDLHEILIAIRSVEDIRRCFVYSPLKALIVRGSTRQISLAAWMLEQLNQPENVPAPAPHEFKLSGNDVVRVLELTNPPNPQALQEITTVIRSVADLPRIFMCTARKALSMRGPTDKVDLAAWLVSELDRPSSPPSADNAPHEYRLPPEGERDNEYIARVFYLPPQSPEDLNQAISLVRRNARIQRAFMYTTLPALALRGTPDQVATAAKALEEIRKARPE